MKITFISNFMNHHQLFFSQCMFNIPEVEYKFVSTSDVPLDRLKMGYTKYNTNFIINANLDKKSLIYALRISYQSDIVIIGSAPEKFVKERLKKGKIVLYCSENIFKDSWVKNIFRFCKYSIKSNRYSNNKFYLCNSAYAAYDYKICGVNPEKFYKFGYFPYIKSEDIKIIMQKKPSNTVHILWVGRFVEYKHPEYAILTIKRLRDEGFNVKLNIIGGGKKERLLKKMISYYELEDIIKLKGNMSPYQVTKEMEMSNIFLFTSNECEGWGAVVNEAMFCGCAIVASHAAGSVPFLIQHNKNGFIYENNNLEDLYKNTYKLVNNESLRRKFGYNAHNIIKSVWSPQKASENLVKLCNSLLDRDTKNDLPLNEPCSKAELLRCADIWNSIQKY